ncbi:nitrogen fixation protein NifQ [Candidatus Albibeggiatoa sp. nov. BB20]|uniref:nitrogen fixation protein NifQ n=1 Tax=Candidatus Albibeggiatoa sp. nov. BB20 TaxID=3162723 RepID=UPI00336587E1
MNSQYAATYNTGLMTTETEQTQSIYGILMQHSQGLPNGRALACMISSLYKGQGAMPSRLGLSRADFKSLLQYHFTGCRLPADPRIELLSDERALESDDLKRLFLTHRRSNDTECEWIADMLIAGCMASDHLWQDLGLWQRADLTALIQYNFPTLAAKNDRDMKWKKFFYKQLCISEGIYICRAPSCEVCADYDNCFGSEE